MPITSAQGYAVEKGQVTDFWVVTSLPVIGGEFATYQEASLVAFARNLEKVVRDGTTMDPFPPLSGHLSSPGTFLEFYAHGISSLARRVYFAERRTNDPEALR